MAPTVVTWGGPTAVPPRYHRGIAALDAPSVQVEIRDVGIAVLGPLELDGTASTMGLRDRVVLEALAVRPGTVVRAESLAEAIWGATPPPSWPKVVQGCVSRLRKVLGNDVIETAEHGYRLRVHVDHLDHLRFERLVGRARELLALGEPERADYLLREALDLWRGDPFTELDGWAPGLIELERLVELHHDAEELHVEAMLRSGRHDDVLAPAVRLLHDAPFRERRWGLLALAQYQSGRQREALDTLHRARSVLVNELGLDPGPDLTALEQAILRQDPSLVVQAAGTLLLQRRPRRRRLTGPDRLRAGWAVPVGPRPGHGDPRCVPDGRPGPDGRGVADLPPRPRAVRGLPAVTHHAVAASPLSRPRC